MPPDAISADRLPSVTARLGALAFPTRLSIAAAAGAASALAMPPLSLWPVLLVTVPLLVALIDGIAAAGARSRLGFLLGFGFGLGYFLVSLSWIGHAFLVDADVYGWMMPFALLGLAGYLALYWGAAIAVATLAWRPGISRVLLFAACMAVAEWLRGHLLTGFPWNALGYAVDGIPGLPQLASVLGIYGVTCAVLLWAALPAILLGTPRRRFDIAVAVVLALGAIPFAAAGSLRLANAPAASPADSATGPRLRLVQANVPQEMKWDDTAARAIFTRYLTLSRDGSDGRGGLDAIDLVVWPESALPFLIDESPAGLGEIAAMLPARTQLVLGALRREGTGFGQRVFNSVLAISSQGAIAATYDKAHLVPFGEFLPMSQWLDPIGVRRFVAAPEGFAAGAGQGLLRLPGLPAFVPLICYEAIFPDFASRAAAPRWLLNVTNDAWFGDSAGPWQHLAQARFRAIESGLPLVRVANTGISAVFDAYGRPSGMIALGQAGTLDAKLPPLLPPTPFSRWGNSVFWLMVLALASLSMIGTSRPP